MAEPIPAGILILIAGAILASLALQNAFQRVTTGVGTEPLQR
jgi:hypothetical protein